METATISASSTKVLTGKQDQWYANSMYGMHPQASHDHSWDQLALGGWKWKKKTMENKGHGLPSPGPTD